MLAGVVIAFPGAIGFVWLLDNANRQRKWLGSKTICVGLRGTAFFYGGATTLHTLAAFGLG